MESGYDISSVDWDLGKCRAGRRLSQVLLLFGSRQGSDLSEMYDVD